MTDVLPETTEMAPPPPTRVYPTPVRADRRRHGWASGTVGGVPRLFVLAWVAGLCLIAAGILIGVVTYTPEPGPIRFREHTTTTTTAQPRDLGVAWAAATTVPSRDTTAVVSAGGPDTSPPTSEPTGTSGPRPVGVTAWPAAGTGVPAPAEPTIAPETTTTEAPEPEPTTETELDPVPPSSDPPVEEEAPVTSSPETTAPSSTTSTP